MDMPHLSPETAKSYALPPIQKNFPQRPVPMFLGLLLRLGTPVKIPETGIRGRTTISYFEIITIGWIHGPTTYRAFQLGGGGRELARHGVLKRWHHKVRVKTTRIYELFFIWTSVAAYSTITLCVTTLTPAPLNNRRK